MSYLFYALVLCAFTFTVFLLVLKTVNLIKLKKNKNLVKKWIKLLGQIRTVCLLCLMIINVNGCSPTHHLATRFYCNNVYLSKKTINQLNTIEINNLYENNKTCIELNKEYNNG